MTPRTLEDDQATKHELYTTNAISRMFINQETAPFMQISV